jgi:hypothetical protein
VKRDASKIRPKFHRKLRALGGRRVVIEGFGRRASTFIAISGGGDLPCCAWLSPGELRKLIEAGKRILR